jgi:nucleotide-binding universal stress UspA family protein
MRFNRILVPTDFSPAADKALDAAIELARQFGGTVVLMHAYGFPSYAYAGFESLVTAEFVTALEHAAREALNEAVRPRNGGNVPIATALYLGVPWEQILVAVQQHEIGLVVIGTHGRRGVAHALLGSVAEKIVRLSPVPVLTVHPPVEQARPEDG